MILGCTWLTVHVINDPHSYTFYFFEPEWIHIEDLLVFNG